MGCCLVTPVPRTAAILHSESRIRGTVIRVAFGDITSEHVDAVISITDPTLSLRAGVPGAIKRNAGLEAAKECEAAVAKAGTPLPLGHTIVTGPGHMPCKRIIHVVGPAHWEDGAAGDVKTAVAAALSKAEELHCGSVSLPGTCAAASLSCAQTVAAAVVGWLQTTDTTLREARLVSWDADVVKAFDSELAGLGVKKNLGNGTL